MTVTTSTNKTIALGNGVTGPPGVPFVFDFIGVNPGYISVIYTDADGVNTTLDASAYTLTLNPALTGDLWGVGGTVAYPLSGPAIAAGTQITILRTLPLLQLITLIGQSSFGQYARSAETGLDLGEMQLQQVFSAFSRAVVANVTDPDINLELPPAAQRALQLMGFDSLGQPIAAEPSSALVSTVMQPVVAAPTLPAARAAMGIDTSTLLPIGAEVDFPGLFPPSLWLLEDGSLKSRTTYALLLDVLAPNLTATVSNGSNSVTGIVFALGDTSALAVGWPVEGANIPAGTVIAGITGANSISMNHAATGNGTAIRVYPYGAGDGASTFQLPNATGRVYASVDLVPSIFSSSQKIGNNVGSEKVTLLQADLPAATLTTTIPAGQGSHVHDPLGTGTAYITVDAGPTAANGAGAGFGNAATTKAATLPAMSGTTALGGSSAPHSNTQPTSFRNKIIYAGV
jgi:microcystin-dependent protein